jgi:hypothetical protein
LIIVLSLILPAAAATAQTPAPAKITVAKFGANSIIDEPGGVGADIVGERNTEIPAKKRLGSSPLRTAPATGDAVPLAPGAGTSTSSGKRAKSNPEVVLSYEGLNHRDSRLAFGGNQYSGEPADQGVCAGNGFVLESVNSALRVYDAATGAPASPVLALNEFYGLPPALTRPTGAPFGPFTFDIECHFDPDSGRWFHLAVDLDQDPATGAYTGKNYLDLAVSATGDPRGLWHIYRIPGMNDGTEGTPNHACPGGPCFADFPHLGVDKNGVFITTNEFPLFDNGFTGAQVYAISKAALTAGSNTIDAYLFNTAEPQWQAKEGQPGFTLWPALSAEKQFAGSQGGTAYFVSSNAVFTDDGSSSEMIVWALSNTSSLNRANPAPRLTKTIVPSQRYAVPPPSVQKPGTIPYGELFYGATEPGLIDTSDSRVLGARLANGKLWAVLGTAAEVEGNQQAGVAWFVFNASVNNSGVSASIRKQGILALPDEALAYPTLGVTASGRGVMGFTRVGPNLHPSYGYASLDDVAGAGEIHMIREGQSPQDGFTEYGGGRFRWGDYGAAAVVGNRVWLAGQYIEQPPCTVADFIATGFTCWSTRTQLANWSTRVTSLQP